MIRDRRFSLRYPALIGYVAAVVAAAVLPCLALAAEGSPWPSGEIWFVRHAESELNVDTLLHPVPDEGVTYPLTRNGVHQANALADALASTPLTTIYSSTRVRAIQTADALAFRHGLSITLAPEAAEIDLGIALDAPDGSQLYRELVDKWLVDKDLTARLGSGESFADAQRRFLPFVRELMNRHADDTGIVVVISHSAMLGLLLPVLTTNVPADYALQHPIPNTGIIKTRLHDGKLFCTEWAGTRNSEFGN
jgi:broad specificity phosphatase PhoE